MSECEYNPETKTAKGHGEPCYHNATVSLAAYNRDFSDRDGAWLNLPPGEPRGNFHMCKCCAALPQFKRRKKDSLGADEESNCVVGDHAS